MRKEKAAEEQEGDKANSDSQANDSAMPAVAPVQDNGNSSDWSLNSPAENPFSNAEGTNDGKSSDPDAGQSNVSAGTSDSVSADTDDIDDEDDDDDDDMDFAAELRKRAFREKSDDDGNS